MEPLELILTLALVVQFITERVKAPIPESMTKWAVPVLSAVISILLCFSCSVGLFYAMGVPFAYFWLDYVLSGIVISGGSTVVNEIIKVLGGIKTNFQD